MFEGRFIYIYKGVLAKYSSRDTWWHMAYAFLWLMSLCLSFVQALCSVRYCLCRNPTNSARHVCLLGLATWVWGRCYPKDIDLHSSNLHAKECHPWIDKAAMSFVGGVAPYIKSDWCHEACSGAAFSLATWPVLWHHTIPWHTMQVKDEQHACGSNLPCMSRQKNCGNQRHPVAFSFWLDRKSTDSVRCTHSRLDPD